MHNKGNLFILSILFGLFTTVFSSCDNTVELPVPDISGTVTDIDGNVYHTVKIGNQTWMVENLMTSKYINMNGDTILISNVADSASWGNLTKIAMVNNPRFAANTKYGKLYNWYAVSDTVKIAPAGWHVATDEDWSKLEQYLIANGGNFDKSIIKNKIGKSLADTSGWKLLAGEGMVGNDLTQNNSSGFAGLPGGALLNGSVGSLGKDGYWWTSTVNTCNDSTLAKATIKIIDKKTLLEKDTVVSIDSVIVSNRYYPISRQLSYSFSNLSKSFAFKKQTGLSIRCVKD